MINIKFPVMLSKEKMNDDFGEALVVYLVLCTDGMDRFWKVPDKCSLDLYNDPIEKYTLENYDSTLEYLLKIYGTVFMENNSLLPHNLRFIFDECHLKPGIHTIRRVKTSS